MLLVIGTENCSRCAMVKNILNTKNINYNYKLIDELSETEQNNYLDIAKQSGQLSYPMIFKNNKIITIQEVQ